MSGPGAPKYGLILPNSVVGGDAAQFVDYAVEAEAAGWDGVFLSDHLIPPSGDPSVAYPDPWITLSGIAARTDDINLGTWITPMPRRQPWQVARDLATLDRLSDGRVILGAGLGTQSDYETFGRPWEPARLGRRYDESLEIIDQLWSGEPVSYDGEFFSLDEAVLRPTPVQEPRIPVIVAGIWPNKRPFHRGARWDGIVPHYRGDGIIPEDGAGFATPRDASISHDEEVRAMMEYYHDIADDPGEVMLPADPPGAGPDWLELCEELGATWIYVRPKDDDGEWHLDNELIRAGPPG